MYRTDLINGAMGAQRLTNESLGEKAELDATTISSIRNGKPSVTLPSLKRVADALGLKLSDLFAEPTPQEKEAA